MAAILNEEPPAISEFAPITPPLSCASSNVAWRRIRAALSVGIGLGIRAAGIVRIERRDTGSDRASNYGRTGSRLALSSKMVEGCAGALSVWSLRLRPLLRIDGIRSSVAGAAALTAVPFTALPEERFPAFSPDGRDRFRMER